MNSNPERDAHLRAALRHAPDAGLAPPPSVSDAILRAARAAVRPPPRRWWLALPWSGSLAGLTAATLFGLIWWPAPPPVPVPPEIDEVVAQAPAPVPELAQTPPPPRAEPVAKSAPAPTPARRAAPVRAREATPEAKVADAAQTGATATAPVAAAAPPAAPAAARMDRPAAAAELRSALADATPPGLARTLLQPSGSTAWRWQVDGEDRPPAAVQAWLARLHEHTRGRWRLHAAALPPGRTLVASEDGQPRARVVLGADAVWWRDEASGSVWRAPLDAGERTRLGDF